MRLHKCIELRVLSFWVLFLVLLSIPACASESSKSPVPIDFSYAGYEAGHAIPDVAPVLVVHPSGADDSVLIQAALDRVATLKPNAMGFRGAVLLSSGRFHVKGQLQMRVSGVVLRGSGTGPNGTILEADGNSRRTLIEIGAKGSPSSGAGQQIVQDTPAGSRVLTLDSVERFATGDKVVVRRPSTDEWISEMGMKGLPGSFANARLDWKPGSHDLLWDRSITRVDRERKQIEIDAPVTSALEHKYGGGSVALSPEEAFPRHLGLQDLMLESAYDASRPKDEEHSWIAVLLDNVQDAWVKNVIARHFVASAVRVNLRGRRITVENCRSEAPVSEEGGYRRQSFLIYGQQVLVHHCYSEYGMNDFASGMLSGGPNVFLDCEAAHSLGASGAFEGWSSGVLYEHVKVPDSSIQLLFDFTRAQGAGWTAANSLIWNSTARTLDAVGPPGAPNFTVHSEKPLYEEELRARFGTSVENNDQVKPLALSSVPEFTLPPQEDRPAIEESPSSPVKIVRGRFVYQGKVLWGESQTEAWWRGDTSLYTAGTSTGWSVTRFMPGVVAPGETEDLSALVRRLKDKNLVSVQINPGLWYEHRRDAHTIERREDGNVWAPFYEMPWARSGKGKAWDGLSLFDLSRYNPWYFERQRKFGRLASQNGLLVFYDLYNTHNVLEIGPHWIDYPWRPANNVNDTGLPEPPPLRPHGRMDVGNEFYSTDYPPLRALHRAYILHTLDELADEPNIIFGLAYQYAGPLAFQEFFLDTVHEWEQQHGKTVRIVLTTSKQTTDAILENPVRSKQIAIVDMRYWEYRPDGTLFAPKAGENHAFRELISKTFPGYTDTPPSTTPEQVYRQVREYRDRYPEIALMPMEEDAGPVPILMAGAASQSALRSQPPAAAPTALQSASAMYPPRPVRKEDPNAKSQDSIVDEFIRTYLAQDLPNMSPADGWVEASERTWVLAGGQQEPVLLYSLAGKNIVLLRGLPARRYAGLWLNPHTGEISKVTVPSVSAKASFQKPDEKDWLLLLTPAP